MVQISTVVWERSQHRGSALLVLVYLAHRADADGSAWPSVSAIGKATNLIPKEVSADAVAQRRADNGKRFVRRILCKLEASGELAIHVGEGPSGGNRYTVCVAQLSKQPTKLRQRGVVECLEPADGL
jgi:hypothetical protein